VRSAIGPSVGLQGAPSSNPFEGIHRVCCSQLKPFAGSTREGVAPVGCTAWNIVRSRG
jgi:hypothetical protein